MKLNNIKKIGPEVKSQRTHIRNGKGGSNGSQNTNQDLKRNKNNQNKSNSNSNNKLSRLQTNQSKVDTDHRYHKNITRIKTEGVSSEIIKTVQKTSIKRFDSLTKRIKTDLTDRTESPAFVQQRFDEDHHNTASLAQLLQFHTGYHEIDQEQFNYRVRKQAQKSKMEQRQSDSQKESRIAIIQSRQKSKDDEQNEKQNQNDNQDEEQEKQQKQMTQQKSYKPSKQSKQSIQQVSQTNRKSKKSILISNDQSEDKPQQIYTLGTVIQSQNKKQKQQTNFKKKPKIRSYSHQQKLKIIQQGKYVPRNQEQALMEKRYLHGQLKTINQIRQAEQMTRILTQYQQSKKKFLQQLARRNEVKRMMSSIKIIKSDQIINQKVRRAISLPKIKPICQQFILPQPQTIAKIKDPFQIQLQKVNQNVANVQHSLSGNRYHYFSKKQTLLRKIRSEDEKNTQIQNIQRIQSILKSKGIGFDVNAVRKGLTTSLKTMPDLDINKFELPRSLISNPKYQKFPL